MKTPILEVKNLKKYFETPNGMLHAVDDISFTLESGKTLGLVGESGCGKSTTGRAILCLTEPTDGQIIFDGKDLMKLSSSELRRQRQDMQIICQDPYSSIDPRFTVAQALGEPIRIHRLAINKGEQHKKVVKLVDNNALTRRLSNY